MSDRSAFDPLNKKQPTEPSISDRVALRRKQRFDEDLDDFETEQEYLTTINRNLFRKVEEEEDEMGILGEKGYDLTDVAKV